MIPKYNSTFLDHVRNSALRIDAEFTFLDSVNGRLALVRRDNRKCLFGAAPIKMWPFNSALAMSIVNDKELTIRLLKDAGVLTPTTEIGFYTTDHFKHLPNIPQSAQEAIKSITDHKGFPIIVKPNNSFGGKGLSIMHEASCVQNAIDLAAEFDNGILAQEYIDGRDFRIYALSGNPIALVERRYSSIAGDAKRTISELIASALPTSQVTKDQRSFQLSVKSYIIRHGDQVLPSGETFTGFPVSNMTQGGHAISISTTVDSDWNDLCQRIHDKFGLTFFAADCRVRGSRSTDIFVLELNANPGIEMLFEGDSILADSVIDMLLNAALSSPDN